MGTRLGEAAKKYPAGKGQTIPVPGQQLPENEGDDLSKRMGGGGTTGGMVDLFGIGRVLDQYLQPPPGKPAPPQADMDKDMAAAIDSIAQNALLPPEGQAKDQPPKKWIYDARVFALDVAKRIDVAQKSNKTEVRYDMPAAYENIADKMAILSAMQDILKKIREARADRASSVTLKVYIPAGASTRVFFTNSP